MQKTQSLYMPVPKGMDLDAIFCIKTDRILRNDNTISYKKAISYIGGDVREDSKNNVRYIW